MKQKTDTPGTSGVYEFGRDGSLDKPKTSAQPESDDDWFVEITGKEEAKDYPSVNHSQRFFVLAGCVGTVLAIGVALWLENRSQYAVESKPHSIYHTPVSSANLPAGPTMHKAYLSNGTPYQFYVIDNHIAVTEVDGKPVIDSLEGKLRK